MIFLLSPLVAVFFSLLLVVDFLGEQGMSLGWDPAHETPSPSTVCCMLQKELSVSMNL